VVLNYVGPCCAWRKAECAGWRRVVAVSIELGGGVAEGNGRGGCTGTRSGLHICMQESAGGAAGYVAVAVVVAGAALIAGR